MPVEETKDWREYITPRNVGLGAAAASAYPMYRYIRRPIANAIAPGQRFARTLAYQSKPKTKLQQWLERQLYGADELHYTFGKKAPEKPAHFKGHVYHDVPTDAAHLRGTSESASVQPAHLKDFMDLEHDKWKEYKTFAEHVPDALPKTQNLADVFKTLGITHVPEDLEGRQAILRTLQAHLKSTHNGFYVKDVAGLQSMGKFPNEKRDFAKLYERYKKSTTPEELHKVRQPEVATEDWEKTWYRERDKPHFSGHILETLLNDPSKAIVQQKIKVRTPFHPLSVGGLGKLNPEMRIHVVGGRVDPSMASYRYSVPLRTVQPTHLNDASAWVQKEVVDKLPPHLRNTSYAMDILPSHGDQPFQIVEANPGGMSGFLHPDVDPLATQRLRRLITGQYSPGFSAVAAVPGVAAIGGAAALGTKKVQDYQEAPPKFIPPETPKLIAS